MAQDANSALRATGHPRFDALLRDCRAWLGNRGEAVIGSGSLRSGRFSATLHTDFGPADQDKATNQDYVLTWRPASSPDHAPLSLVLTLSDGLTSSFRSETAAALACWTAARALVESEPSTSPEERARRAFAAAGQTIGQLADELARDLEASCPEGQFPSTWKYILKKGALLQTTLTLAWIERDCFFLAAVGDGGALWRSYTGETAAREVIDRVLATCNLDTQQVNALGPGQREVTQFDCWHMEKIVAPFLCALSTDGISRGLGERPLQLLDDLDDMQRAGQANPAQRFIQQAIQDRPKDFDDNLTLVVIRAE